MFWLVIFSLYGLLCQIEGSSFEPKILPEDTVIPLTVDEITKLRDESKEMFYHGYNSYMDKAYPADELMPLSCRGRYRGLEVSRGDIDEASGNFSLTLVDALDTLVILGDFGEFEKAVRLVIRDVHFNSDVIVSVFESNIRMVGGLISGHVLAEQIKQLYGAMPWYKGELLDMAKDLATRLLPAFNTTTSIPYPRINLRHGMKPTQLQSYRDTCTACAGTIVLEFATLSRLTNDKVFEEKARQVMDYLWAQRNRGSNLMGTVLNVHSGDWIRRDSGVGAGIDSYYEYLLKGYILLGEKNLLDRFNKHYSGVMKYVSQGPMLLDVHMHRPHTTSRNYMDALLAFWPGLQVMKGDIKPAVETHEMLYQLVQKHNFLPEAFTADFQVHWGQHLLRPEFLESTYILYQATGDHYYLRVGEKILKSLQKHTWVPCGYAAVSDVRTRVHEDRMDSFVLAETFKYLYLLFTEPKDIPINLEDFILSTEAHLFPLSIARQSYDTIETDIPQSHQLGRDELDSSYTNSCPNAYYLFSGRDKFTEVIRKPMHNFVGNICPAYKVSNRKLVASDFQPGNLAHLNMLKDMGITIMTLQDGRLQLLHSASNAKSSEDAEEGLLFITEMIELSKAQQIQPDNPPRSVSFSYSKYEGAPATKVSIVAAPAQFGLELSADTKITGPVIKADPIKGCSSLKNEEQIKDHIVIIERGECMFIEKARLIQSLGALGGIVVDNTDGSTSENSPMFAMSGDGNDDVSIPLVFLFKEDAKPLMVASYKDQNLLVTLGDHSKKENLLLNKKSNDFIFQTTGPTVKSSLKKRQTTTANIIQDLIKLTEEDDDLVKTFMDSVLKNSHNKLELAMSEKGVLDVVSEYISFLKNFKTNGEIHVPITLLVERILMFKAAKDPELMKSLLTNSINDLVQLMRDCVHVDDIVKILQSVVRKAFIKEVFENKETDELKRVHQSLKRVQEILKRVKKKKMDSCPKQTLPDVYLTKHHRNNILPQKNNIYEYEKDEANLDNS